MGFTWPSLGRWTSNKTRAQPSRSSREPYRHAPASSRATTTTTECYSPTTAHEHEDDGEDNYDAPDFSVYSDSSPTEPRPHLPPPPPPPRRSVAPLAQGIEETESLLRGESPAALIKLIQRTKGAERWGRRSDTSNALEETDDDALHVTFGPTTTVCIRGGAAYDDGLNFSSSADRRRWSSEEETTVRDRRRRDSYEDLQEFEDWRHGETGGCRCGCGCCQQRLHEDEDEDEELEEERDEAEEVIRRHRQGPAQISGAVPSGKREQDGANAASHRSEAPRGKAEVAIETSGVGGRDGLLSHPTNGMFEEYLMTAEGPVMVSVTTDEMTLVDYTSGETSLAEVPSGEMDSQYTEPSDGQGSRPRLPSLYFQDLVSMVEEAGISAPSIPVTSVVNTNGPDQMQQDSSSPSQETEVLFDFSEHMTTEMGEEQNERSIGDMLTSYEAFSGEFEGWQTDADEEEDVPPEAAAHEIIRPVTGLGWYDDCDDDERSKYSDDGAQNSVTSIIRADGQSNVVSDRGSNFPVRKDSLEYSPRALTFSEASYTAVMGERNTTTEASELGGTYTTPMRAIVDNTSGFLQSTTAEDEHWVSCPTSPRPSSSIYDEDLSENEEEIDDLIDIYATTPPSSKETQPSSFSHHEPPLSPSSLEGDLFPPYHPSSPSALTPLHTIARGLSLDPSTTPYHKLQSHLARNANILRYLVLHCVPAPDINPLEPVNDLVEPILPPPLTPGLGEYAQNFPSHPRRREYTRLLQAIRSVQWSADTINDMLAVVDFHSPLPSPAFPAYPSHQRASTAIPAFRKLRTADAEQRGCLTSAQLHELSTHGISLLDVLQMNDVPRVVSAGLGGRLVQAAASGALGVAKECNLLDEEGALLELLADPEESSVVKGSTRSHRRRRVGRGSGLRYCVGVDDEGETDVGDHGPVDEEMDDDEDEGYEEGACVDVLGGEVGIGHVAADDGTYLVSPLSPESHTVEHNWGDQNNVSLAMATSPQSEDLMTFSDDDDIQDPSSDNDNGHLDMNLHVRPLNITRKKPTLKRSHNFRELSTVDENTNPPPS
ncbi:hypothetical protein CORC01_13891 [Colletotrichum orchidophilum]|uniref:Uncharacterized protein n=1 Tax=Colletotrichum orchidophilum TaxID=1209926 RepID=A0A1G4ANT5_9PEZI|nr:uncharacterized protein CORC01_13891 [Colletotrichum orchidophilum]OHE90817.1 hypothetical protein CORC01_13891 [Colletotrichum orchidophilum]